nr:metallophosphoesterase [Actinomycetota bacterium]
RIVLSPGGGSPGARLRVRGRGFPARARLRLTFRGDRLRSFRADGRGRFATSFLVPPATAGVHAATLRSRAARLRIRFAVLPPASPAAPSDPVLAAAGDIACAASESVTALTCRQEATARALESLRPDAVATLGDNQYPGGSLADFSASFDPTWGRLKAAIRPAPGNHEYATAGAAGYFDYFGAAAGDRANGYYSYDLGAWHVVVLNSNCGIVSCAPGSAQLTWLEDDLARHPRACVLAYWHHPRFSSGRHGDDPSMQPAWEILAYAGADVVLSGHDHDYERFAPIDAAGVVSPRGMRQFVVGTGGKSLYALGPPRGGSEVRDSSAFGVLALTLHPAGYSWRFVPEEGAAFADTGSDACH